MQTNNTEILKSRTPVRGRARGRTNPEDVANLTVRCLLSDASELLGSWNDAERERTLTFFEGRCAYTGEPLTGETLIWDHLVPHNREACGLRAESAPTTTFHGIGAR